MNSKLILLGLVSIQAIRVAQDDTDALDTIVLPEPTLKEPTDEELKDMKMTELEPMLPELGEEPTMDSKMTKEEKEMADEKIMDQFKEVIE